MVGATRPTYTSMGFHSVHQFTMFILSQENDSPWFKVSGLCVQAELHVNSSHFLLLFFSYMNKSMLHGIKGICHLPSGSKRKNWELFSSFSTSLCKSQIQWKLSPPCQRPATDVNSYFHISSSLPAFPKSYKTHCKPFHSKNLCSQQLTVLLVWKSQWH